MYIKISLELEKDSFRRSMKKEVSKQIQLPKNIQRADQINKRLFKNGNQNIQKEKKPIVFVIQDWIKRRSISGGKRTKMLKNPIKIRFQEVILFLRILLRPGVIQIQKLLSEKQELVSTVAEQGKRIAEQTEQIEKLNEADNVLKLNAELKKQNEKLKQDKLNAEQEAEATVSSVKREYEAKGRELDRRIGEAAKQSASLKSERQSISEDIEQRATAKYLDQKKELDRKFKAQTASYDSFLLGLLLYGVLTTVFTAVRSEAFVSDFKTFFMVIWQFIVNAFQLLLKGGQWASQLGDKIPQPVVATIVHYLLLIVFVGGIAIGVGFLIFLGASKVFEFYTEDYADTMSLAVFLISLAVSVYFAEPIRAVIPINLLLLLILVHIVYVLIRWYVKGCMRSRGYY